MINDTSRKIYTTLFNLCRYEEFELNVSYISRISARTEQQVKESINDLIKNKHLSWNKETGIYKLMPQPKDIPNSRYLDQWK